MAKEVDQRIVEMRFENEQFQRNIRQTIKSLDNLSDKLAMDTASRGFDELQRLVDKFNWGSFSHGLDMVMDKVNSWSVLIERKVKTAIIDKVANWSESLVKSMTAIGQAGSGYSKYTEKMESVMTIMNATGLSMEKVNEYLEELMLYSDETSFSFTEMTKALATFTSSGAKIDDVVPMIEGIANATAHAGKGGQALNSALLNLSQSFGSGYLQSIDWKSVVGQGIGSKSLKEAFIESAKALGTLNKEGKTAKGTLVTVGNFNDTLKEKWVNTDVMTATFKSYAAMFTEAEELVKSGKAATITKALEMLDDKYDGIAKDSFNAAQNTKSFKEAIDATKDAVSSGWLRTFEIIFGNFEEAKEMWTDLTDRLWEAFASGEEDRNKFFTQWRAWDGRLNMIRAFQNAWDAVMNVLDLVKDAIDDIFPNRTGKNLAKFTKSLADLTEQFKLFDWYVNAAGEDEKVFTPLGLKVKNVFDGISSVLGTVVDFFKELIKQSGRVITSMKPLASTLINFMAELGKRLGLLREKVNGKNSFAMLLEPIADAIIKFVKMVTPFVQGGFDDLLLFVDDVSTAMKQLGNITFFDSIKAVGTSGLNMFKGFLDAFIDSFVTMFENLKKRGVEGILEDGKETLGKIVNILGGILSIIANGLMAIAAWIFNTVSSTAGRIKLGVIGFVVVLGLIFSKLIKAVLAIKKIVDIFASIHDVFEDVKRSIRKINIMGIVMALTGVIIGLFLISAAISNIAEVWRSNRGGFTAAILSIAGIMGLIMFLFAIVKATAKHGSDSLGNFGKFAAGIGIAINLITTAIISIAKENDPAKVKDAFNKVGLILIGMGAFAYIMMKNAPQYGGADVFKGISAMFVGMSLTIIVIARAIRLLGRMDPEELWFGTAALSIIVAVVGTVAILLVGLVKANADIEGVGKVLKGMALTILTIAGTVRWIGKVLTKDPVDIFAGMAWLAAVLYGLSEFIKEISKELNENSKNLGQVSKILMALGLTVNLMVAPVLAIAAFVNAFGVGGALSVLTGVGVFVVLIGAIGGMILAISEMTKNSKNGEIKIKGLASTLMALGVAVSLMTIPLVSIALATKFLGADAVGTSMLLFTLFIGTILGFMTAIAYESKDMDADALKNRFKGISSVILSMSLLVPAITGCVAVLSTLMAINPAAVIGSMAFVEVLLISLMGSITIIMLAIGENKVDPSQIQSVALMVAVIGAFIVALTTVMTAMTLVQPDSDKLLKAAASIVIIASALALVIASTALLKNVKPSTLGMLALLVGVFGAVITAIALIAENIEYEGGISETLGGMVTFIIVLAAVIGGLIVVADKFVAGAGLLIGVLAALALPIAAIALVLIGLSRAIEEFRKTIQFMNNETEWKGIKAFFTMLRDEIPATLVTIMMSVALGFSAMMTSILTTAAKSSVKMRGLWYAGIMMAIGGIIDALYDGSAIIGKYIPGIAGNLGQGFMVAFCDKIRAKFGWLLKLIGLEDEFEKVSENAIAGFDKGLKNSQDEVSEAVRNYLAKNAVDTAETELDIRSPSRVFAAIGNFVSLGMAKGIKDGSPEAVKATEDAVGAITGAAEGKLKNIDFDGIENAMSSVVNQVNSANPTLAFNYAGALQQAEYERMMSLQGLQQLAADTALSVKDAIAINVHHSFDTLRIEGVNDRKTLVETIEVSVEEILGKIVRKQGRM